MHATATQENSPARVSRVVAANVISRLHMASATEHLLTQGGDARIELNALGANRYGCAPRPDPGLTSFGSSTASVISEVGFQAAMALHTRLHSNASSYGQELERQRQELLVLSGGDRVAGTQIVLAASGTDLHLFAAHLARGDAAASQSVMVEPSETGSGVTAALSAVHFASSTSQGRYVGRGASIAGVHSLQAACVSLRHPDGSPRSIDEVDAEFTSNVQRVVRAGHRCLLVVTDISKTGLLAPSVACAVRLQQMYVEQLEVLVDACQFRMSSTTLASYLAQNFMVAITGSKFVGGPAFCGALLLPPGVARRCAKHTLHALRDYSSQFDWPLAWPGAESLSEKSNPGLLLRWEAALADLRRFKSIPDSQIKNILQTWAQAVATRLATDPTFEALPVLPLKRADSDAPGAWDSIQTIFPFLLYKRTASGQRKAVSTPEIVRIYHLLLVPPETAKHNLEAEKRLDPRFQLGQPVPCGQKEGLPVSALRFCAGARLVTELAHSGQSANAAVARAMQAFDKLAELSQRQ